MAGSKVSFRIYLTCDAFSDGFCSAFRDFLGVKGLKSLFFKNVLLAIDTGNEEEVKERLASILMGKFKVVFDGGENESKPRQYKSKKETTFDAFKDELSQISSQFAKSLSAEDK